MINFQFNKLWFTTTELLEIIPISRAFFYKMHRDLIEQGLDGSQMGKVLIKGSENVLWCPIKFVEYLKQHKVLTQPIQYTQPEKAEQDNVIVAVGKFNKQHRRAN